MQYLINDVHKYMFKCHLSIISYLINICVIQNVSLFRYLHLRYATARVAKFLPARVKR